MQWPHSGAKYAIKTSFEGSVTMGTCVVPTTTLIRAEVGSGTGSDLRKGLRFPERKSLTNWLITSWLVYSLISARKYLFRAALTPPVGGYKITIFGRVLTPMNCPNFSCSPSVIPDVVKKIFPFQDSVLATVLKASTKADSFSL